MQKLIYHFAIAVVLVIPTLVRVAALTSNSSTKITKDLKFSPQNSLIDIVTTIIQISSTSGTKNNANESKQAVVHPIVNHQSVENLTSVEFSNGSIANPITLQQRSLASFNHLTISRFTTSGTSS